MKKPNTAMPRLYEAVSDIVTGTRQPPEDFVADAHRLALELECLLLSTKDTVALSRWWDSAHEALEQHRQLVRDTYSEPPANPMANHVETSGSPRHARVNPVSQVLFEFVKDPE